MHPSCRYHSIKRLTTVRDNQIHFFAGSNLEGKGSQSLGPNLKYNVFAWFHWENSRSHWDDSREHLTAFFLLRNLRPRAWWDKWAVTTVENQIWLGRNQSWKVKQIQKALWKKSLTGVSPPGDWKEEPPVAAAVATACIPRATTAENGRLPRVKNFLRERQRAKLYFFEL